MSRHCGRQVWIVWVPHHNMSSAFNNIKTIGPIETAEIVLAPSKGRLTHTGQQLMFPDHIGTP
jgi:hypothetical protein